ncbi:MAG: YbgA family protein, partial [Firmicutes bacterium]|nr:YbgA family protein [Bacillota bacterium]
NISAVKCINCTSTNLTRAALELEWSRYKYLILEASPVRYHAMEKLLNGNSSYPALAFYNDIEEALQEEKSKENFLNAAQQIWHAFEHRVSPAEVKSIFKSMGMYKENQLSSSAIKNRLWKIAVKYQQENLVNSYYFVM